MNVRRRIASVFAVGALVTTGVVGLGAAPASAAAYCIWYNVAPVQVHENPSLYSIELKRKAAYSTMVSHTDFCATTVGTDGRTWVAVETAAASDGVGYVIANQMVLTQRA